MKFVDADGMFLAPEKAQLFLGTAQEPVNWSQWNSMGKLTHDNNAIDRHIAKVLAIPYLNIDQIRNRQFKVVIDSVNGAGGLSLPDFERARLYCL
jgi:phosphomannomutase